MSMTYHFHILKCLLDDGYL